MTIFKRCFLLSLVFILFAFFVSCTSSKVDNTGFTESPLQSESELADTCDADETKPQGAETEIKEPDSDNISQAVKYYDTAEDIFKKYNILIDNTDYKDKSIKLTKEQYDNLIDYIENIETEYSHEKYYLLDEALKEYSKLGKTTIQSHDGKLEQLTVDCLFKRVKENNAAFMEQKRAEYIDSFYTEFSDKDLKKYCTIIVNTAKHFVDSGKVDNVDEVMCVLGDLKILSRPITSNASVYDDNSLIISPHMIKALDIKKYNEYHDPELSTITHESIHLLQKGCPHQAEHYYAIGPFYRFDDLSVNSLFVNWFYEGCAEKNSLNLSGFTPMAYTEYVNTLNTISSVLCFVPDVSVSSVEEISLYNSLDHLYETFGCKTESEKKEVLKMLFSLDIVLNGNEGFVQAVLSSEPNADIDMITCDVQNSAYETLTKYFYKNLARFVFENEIPLNDVFYYITVFEHDVFSSLRLTRTENLVAAKRLIKKYNEIQNTFFEIISKGKDFSCKTLFENYGLLNGAGNKNFSFTSMPQEKVELYSFILNSKYNTKLKNFNSLA